MRPQQADQAFGQLRQVVVELLAQASHEEGEALEQPLYIRVVRTGLIQVELRRPVRERLGKLLARLTQVAHFRIEIAQRQIVHAHH